MSDDGTGEENEDFRRRSSQRSTPIPIPSFIEQIIFADHFHPVLAPTSSTVLKQPINAPDHILWSPFLGENYSSTATSESTGNQNRLLSPQIQNPCHQ